MMRLVVRLRSIGVTGATLPVLNAAEFTLRPGITCLYGASGSGKSTLVKAIIGARRLLISGDVRLEMGQRVLTPIELRSAGSVAHLSQEAYLPPWLTMAKALRFPLSLSEPVRQRFDRGRLDSVCNKLGLSEHLGKRPAELSFGQRRRALLAMCLAFTPEVLLLDEFLSAQDPVTVRQCIDVLVQVVEADGSIVLLTTHDPALPGLYGFRAIGIRDARVEEIGHATPSDEIVQFLSGASSTSQIPTRPYANV